MSSPGPRRSVDSTRSSISTASTLSQLPLPSASISNAYSRGLSPGPRRLDSRRSSIASSSSIGGALDPAQRHSSIAEVGQNGE